MKRQRDLFGFFQPVAKVLQQEDAAVASEKCSTPTESKVSRRISKSSRTPDTHSRANVVLLPAERSLTQEDNEACFLIPGTPDHTQSLASQAARSPLSPLMLTSRPTFQQSQSTYSPVERPRRRAVAKRRSSFTVRRQAELDEKCSVVLNSPPALTGESQAVRDYRQAKTAAFVRRGNYDQLNYAPSDQIPTHPDDRSSINSELRLGNFKPRSTLLVSKALCQGNSHCGFPENRVGTGSRKQPLLNSDSFTECISVSENENEEVPNDENLVHFSDNPPSRTGMTVINSALRQNLAYNKRSVEIDTPPDNPSDVFVSGHGVFPDASLSRDPNTQLLISEPRDA
ncbi:unnamed protein product [Dicrocoelium dendriticum]|nr:unnamed protein product [Dicrocoelium dendriticum]